MADEQKQEKLFPLERILTTSARNYCDSVGKNLGDYHLIAVDARVISSHHLGSYPDIKTELAKRVPEGAEMVTNYITAIAMNNFTVIQYASATALIPKREIPDTGGPVPVKRFG